MLTTSTLNQLFSLKDRVAIVTGSTGVLGGAMAHGLAAAGAKVAILGRRAERAAEVADAINANGGVQSFGFTADYTGSNVNPTNFTLDFHCWQHNHGPAARRPHCAVSRRHTRPR